MNFFAKGKEQIPLVLFLVIQNWKTEEPFSLLHKNVGQLTDTFIRTFAVNANVQIEKKCICNQSN